MRIRVVGIGSAFGDDAVGPRVVQALAAGPPLPPGVDTRLCARPVDLLDALEGVDGVVLVDATRSGRAPGTVHEPEAAALCEARAVSSHGVGVREALALARALRRSAPRLAIVGVEAETTSGVGLSAPVLAALAEAGARVRARCSAWHAESEALREGSSDA